MVNKETMVMTKILMINPTNKIILNKTDKEIIINSFKIITIPTDSLIKVKDTLVANNSIILIINKVKDSIIILVKVMIKEISMTGIKGSKIKDQETSAEIITGEGMVIIKDSIIMILGTIDLYKKIFLHQSPFLLNLIQQSKFHNKINCPLLILGLF